MHDPEYWDPPHMSQEFKEAIRTLAKKQGRTPQDVIRDAIGLEKWFLDQQSEVKELPLPAFLQEAIDEALRKPRDTGADPAF